MKGVNVQVATLCGVRAEAVHDDLSGRMGNAGCAQPLVKLLADVFAEGETQSNHHGRWIWDKAATFLCFGPRDIVANASASLGVEGWLSRRKIEENYIKYLSFRGILTLDGGMRAEADTKTPLTTLYRNRKTVLGLVGGRCTETGTVQFPKSEISVSQNKRTVNTQEDHPLAERLAHISTYTADNLAYTPDPPGCYGAIQFEGGGRLLTEFTDVEPDTLFVGMPVRMMFRQIKAIDGARGFKRYFWKAVPDYRVRAKDA